MPETLEHGETPQTWVYFVLDRVAKSIKIGWSTDPHTRVVELQQGNSTHLELVATALGDRDAEQRLHAMWAPLKIRGEWFAASDELLSYIASIKAHRARLPTGGTPDHVRGLMSLDEIRAKHVRYTLDVFGGNKTAAARALGINRRSLYRWIGTK